MTINEKDVGPLFQQILVQFVGQGYFRSKDVAVHFDISANLVGHILGKASKFNCSEEYQIEFINAYETVSNRLVRYYKIERKNTNDFSPIEHFLPTDKHEQQFQSAQMKRDYTMTQLLRMKHMKINK